MSGLGPTLYLPHGASGRWLLRFAKPEDGSAIDLTLATAVEFLVKRSSTTADEDAALTLTLAAGLTTLDAVAGLVQAAVTAAQSAELVGYGGYFYLTRAIFSDGRVIIPDGLRGTLYTDLAAASQQELDEDCVKRLDAASGTLTPVTPDMSNYTINRYDLTGLTGGAATDLDGIAAETLAELSDGTVVELFFTGAISARFRLRARVGAEAEDAPWVIIADHDTDRVWELIGVMKDAVACGWNSDTGKFHQHLLSGTGTAVISTPAAEADAFELPA